MKIEKINFAEEETSGYGLKAIHMDRLSQVVLIAGKNGSGKTRLLKMLKNKIQEYPNENSYLQSKQNLSDFNVGLKGLTSQIKELEDSKEGTTLSSEQQEGIKAQLKRVHSNIDNHQEQIQILKKKLESTNNIIFKPEKLDNHLVDFVPKSLILQDSYTISDQQLDGFAKRIYTIGTNNIEQGTIPAIAKIQKSWVHVNTPESGDLDITPEEKEKINADYKKLKEYIKLFLNTDLKRTKEGYSSLFNKRIGEADLSDGQKILLQFCLALFAQEASLENLIIFLDEPENHLHPAALIEVLDKITPHVKNGQIWIATHSINILAHFSPSNIWYINDGEISYAGNIPRTVLEGLLGNEEEIERLSHFLSLPAQIANDNFAFESLFYPKVLVTKPDDPQIAQIHEIIKEKLSESKKLKILDFGIGKGRLLSTIFENERIRGVNVVDWLDFYGYDPDEEHKNICLQVFDDVYGTGYTRYFNTTNDLLSKVDEKSLDFIIMCNVFHEIDPAQWVSLFNSPASPIMLLKDDGHLLIIEDQFLAAGEKAHSKGFLVFDELELKKLFKITSSDNYKSTDYRKNGRLKSHHIPKLCLNRIDADSRRKSIEILLQKAKDEIKKIRKSNPSFRNGKLHGFWAQQLANASLALEEL